MAGYDPNADDFNEPQSTDQTSAYPEPTYTHPNPYLQQAMRKQANLRKQRTPSSLARAIAMAKRARPSRQSYGD